MVGPPPKSWDVGVDRARAFPMAPGIWQLRLPLAWPAVPHVNAYVLEDEGGPVLVDCGSAGHPSNRAALAAALASIGLAVGDVALLLATHAHTDHIGLAQWVIDQSGCEFRMHADCAHLYDTTWHPDRIEAARMRRAGQEGVPEADLPAYGDISEETLGIEGAVAPDVALGDGDRVGPWEVLETPGHAPSHVCFVDAERRAIILGDLLSSRFVAWFDYGYSADPVGEYLRSLDRVAALGAFDLALPGHGRALDDVEASVAEHRRAVQQRLEWTLAAVAAGPAGAHVLRERVFGPQRAEQAVFSGTEVACYLRHLRLAGAVARHEDAGGRFAYTLT